VDGISEIGKILKLLRTHARITQRELAASLSKISSKRISRDTIAQIENNKQQPSLDFLGAVAKEYGLTIDALLNTRYTELEQTEGLEEFKAVCLGNMQNGLAGTCTAGLEGLGYKEKRHSFTAKKEGQPYSIALVNGMELRMIPFFEIETALNPVTLLENKVENADHYLSIPGFEDCDISIINYGGAMEPEIFSGDIIVGKRVTNPLLIAFGEIYLVITPDYRLVKRIKAGQEPDTVLLCSNQKEFDPIPFQTKDISCLFMVKGVVKRRNI
jgi:transcriptional regulator with XRE-family HTH domain